jgi:hypothetical protein
MYSSLEISILTPPKGLEHTFEDLPGSLSQDEPQLSVQPPLCGPRSAFRSVAVATCWKSLRRRECQERVGRSFTTYVFAAIVRKRPKLKTSMHGIVQILSLTLFERKRPTGYCLEGRRLC